MLIGKRLKELRKAKGLNQEQLGKLVNVTKVSICCYERGTRTPNLDTFQDLLNVLGVSADYLMGNDTKVDVVKDDEVLYSVKLPKEAVELYEELALNKELYRKVMETDPKRIVELIDKILK
ncbi:MAG TPA: helix-turn-helix transcriptional regulator [Mollicutes bacterium]|nr:helix-turn-helix transcriptional regulator [Mollicutes bacterium]